MVSSISIRDDVVKPCIPPMIVGVLAWLASLAPQIGPYLLWHLRINVQVSAYPGFRGWTGWAFALPIWAWLPIPAIFWTFCTIGLRWFKKPITREAQPRPQKVLMGGLEWEVAPEFFANYQDVEDPALGALWIKGPYCVHCKISLRQADQFGLGEEYMMLPNPCPSCETRHSVPSNVSLLNAKAQVYREVQRQVRAGQLVRPAAR